MVSSLIAQLEKDEFKPTSLQDFMRQYDKEKHFKDVIVNLVETGELVRMNDAIYLTSKSYNKALSLLKAGFEDKGKLTLGECKDLLETSRKYIVPIMEYLDSNGITKRVGDERMLR
jgi:selenocysteine-specific elongation factor